MREEIEVKYLLPEMLILRRFLNVLIISKIVSAKKLILRRG